MKPSFIITLLLVGMACSFQACKKIPATDSQSDSDQQLIQSAKSYFETTTSQMAALHSGNKRIDAIKTPYWDAAYSVHTSKGPAVVVPVYYQKHLVVTTNFSGTQVFTLDQLTKLFIYKDSAAYHMELITAFPDSAGQSLVGQPFSGIVFIETWQGQKINSYKLIKGQAYISTDTATAQKAYADHTITSGNKTSDLLIANCGTITGFNYSVDDPDDTYSWSEPAGCTYSYLAGPEGPGISPFQALLPRPGPNRATIEINPPNNIVGNIGDYLKCFSNYGGTDHIYQVTVCVDQPDPGTRMPWMLTTGGLPGSSAAQNILDVGHAFLVLSETFSGYSIVRNVGFYPSSSVVPWSASSQGTLNNDADHQYNISLTVTVDNGQFFNILNYISQGNNAGFMYNLNTNNCTTFALQALNAGNVTLPSTIGQWTGGFGNDPGDLGEDIRGMALPANMTRNTTDNAHPNQYTCN